MAKQTETARKGFAETKTWQRAKDLFVKMSGELVATDDLDAEPVKEKLTSNLLKICGCLAQAVEVWKYDQKRYLYHVSINTCVETQSLILLGKEADYFDLTHYNEEIEILIKQIGATIAHFTEKKTNVVDKMDNN